MLCVLCIIIASVYFDGVAHLCGYLQTAGLDYPGVVFGTCDNFQYHIRTLSPVGTVNASASLVFDLYGAVGWSLVLTLALTVWTALSIFHLFLQCQVLNGNKACCRMAWTTFSLMVCIGVMSHHKTLVVSS